MTAPTLPEFILARVADDEAVAWATLEPVRNVHTGEDIGFGTEWEWYIDKVDQEWGEADHPGERHVARHDPARVLAQCAAYRGLIEAAWRDEETMEGEWGSGRSREQMEADGVFPEALKHLAAIWSDHPDYREEWRP